uniref:Uncharacterized protein n=1 Tax=Arundo donax TaxID=35708 RepID=A0A0A9C5Q7_ARUDO
MLQSVKSNVSLKPSVLPHLLVLRGYDAVGLGGRCCWTVCATLQVVSAPGLKLCQTALRGSGTATRG